MKQRNLRVIYGVEGYTLDGRLVVRRYAHDIETARKIAANITGADIKKMPKYAMTYSGIETMIIKAINYEAKQFAFGPFDDPSDEDIEEVCDTLYEFCEGMKVFVSEPLRDFIGHIRFIYSYEIRTGNRYDGDDIDDSFPHLYKEGSRI